MRLLDAQAEKFLSSKKSALKSYLINTASYYSYYHKKIDDKIVYISSQSGANLAGNMLRIAQELSTDEYKKLKIYIQVKKSELEKIKNIARRYKINAKFLTRTPQQLYILEQAKYIFLDTCLPRQFVKRDGQIVTNTWHGVPFKTIGRRVGSEKHTLGNCQRNFYMSDYIVFPNEYTRETFIRDYMLNNLWRGTSLMAAYPRNEVFFDEQRKREVKSELGLDGKEVFAYLPTYRGELFKRKDTKQTESVLTFLEELDVALSDKQVLIVKLHLYNKQKIDFSKYKHIIGYPDDYETYDVLNVADCLITDYSSVFFDFANTRKKIVLFAYDEEEYFADRGTYFGFDELPFPKVDNLPDLIREINLPKNYDDREFLKKYCPFDDKDAARKLCEHVIKGKKSLVEKKGPCNKKNVLIYVGNLSKNGITTAAVSLLGLVDHSKYNYTVVFSKEITKSAERVNSIPEHVNYYAIDGRVHFQLAEKIAYLKLLKQESTVSYIDSRLEKLFDREWEKYFHGMEIHAAIDFGGYDKEITFIFSRNQSERVMFVHNDMVRDAKMRKSVRLPIFHYFYNKFNKLAIVSETLFESTAKIKGNEENIFVVNNCHDYERVKRRAEETITFERDTECIVNDPRGLTGILEDNSLVKFVTIGRFSPEKGHLRLIDAFEKYWLQNKNCFLIIIGGHGSLFSRTVNYVRTKQSWRNIAIVKSIMNPMPILKKCDLFILSSTYEGLGLVLLEADCLGIPTVSTDIVGPRAFYQKYSGTLVESSEEGLLEAMMRFKEGKVKCLDVDYAEYNKKALSEFEALLDNQRKQH